MTLGGQFIMDENEPVTQSGSIKASVATLDELEVDAKRSITMNTSSESSSSSSDNTSEAIEYNYNFLLKQMNKRKLHLPCPLCQSPVVNLSDHLAKTHSIVDVKQRKLLLNAVRNKYILNPTGMRELLETNKYLLDKVDVNFAAQASPSSEAKQEIFQDISSKVLNLVETPDHTSNDKRKLVRCPLCVGENVFFVNISDHLIKKHSVNGVDRAQILTSLEVNARTDDQLMGKSAAAEASNEEKTSSQESSKNGLKISRKQTKKSRNLPYERKSKKINKENESVTLSDESLPLNNLTSNLALIKNMLQTVDQTKNKQQDYQSLSVKIADTEKRLDETISSFNIFTAELFKNVSNFKNKLNSACEEMKALKQNLAELQH